MSNQRIGGVGPVDTLLQGAAGMDEQLLEQLRQVASGGLGDVGALGINRTSLGRSQLLLLANALSRRENDSINRVIESMGQ